MSGPRLTYRLLAVAVLLAVYLLTLGSLAPGDIAIGLALAVLMELGWRRRVERGGPLGVERPDVNPRPPLHRALLALPMLLLAVIGEITRGTWNVTWFSLGLRPVEHDGFVELEIEGISSEGLTVWAFITTISPGEVVVDIDEQRGSLMIHTLDARDPEATRAHHRRFYERYQRKVVP